jgi:DNA primase
MALFDTQSIELEDFFECLSIRNVAKATASEYRFSCPFPDHNNGDEKASAYMNEDTTSWFCHGCKARGEAVGFTAAVLGVSPLEAIRMLKERYQPGGINPDAVSMIQEVGKIFSTEEAKHSQPLLDENALDRFRVDWEDVWANPDKYDPSARCLFDRGFDPQALKDWEFGYDSLSGRVTFAVRDELGRLIGFKARALSADMPPKYLILGDSPNKRERYGWKYYFPSRVVFGANRVPRNSELVITEGELNAIAVQSRTKRPAVAINGSYFSDDHARIIRDRASKAILFLDNDPAGQDAVWGHRRKNRKGKSEPGIVDKLIDFMPVYVVQDQDKDAAELDGHQINQALDQSESSLLLSLANLV